MLYSSPTAEVLKGTFRLPYMRGPMHMEGFLTSAEVDMLLAEVHLVTSGPTNLHLMPPSVKELIQAAATRWFSKVRRHSYEKTIQMVPQFRETLEIVGDRWTIGDGDIGMHEHCDASYQGGDWTLLIYLTDVARGGETVFDDLEFVPRVGTALVFSVDALHHARHVAEGHKVFVAFEGKVILNENIV
jgi:hypothetical protein